MLHYCHTLFLVASMGPVAVVNRVSLLTARLALVGWKAVTQAILEGKPDETNASVAVSLTQKRTK